jgi:hypothetical protein
MIKAQLRYGLLISFLFMSSLAWSQRSVLPDDNFAMGDTLASILEDTRNDKAMAIAKSLSTVWASLGAENEKLAADQIRILYNKKFPLRPYIATYAAVLVNAVNTEGISTQKMNEWLVTASQVMEKENRSNVLNFLKTSERFFLTRELYSNNSNSLRVNGGTYAFEYVSIPEFTEVSEEEPLESTPEEEEAWDDEHWEDVDDGWEDEPSDQDWDTEWEEEEPLSNAQSEIMNLGAEPLPVVEGAILRINQASLNFVTPYDSVFLENTTGALKISDHVFVGEGGRFSWEMAGLPGQDVYADLSGYSFDVRKPWLEADGAKMTYSGRLKQPVEGVFEYKGVRNDSVRKSTYPRFMSYYSDIEVEGFGPDIQYIGGFALRGEKIYSSSVFGDLSTIHVTTNGMSRFKASANVYEFQDSLITTKRAKIVIYQAGDSIYHPAVRMNYEVASRKLVLLKDKEGYRNTPYSASYFDMDFTADMIRWDLESDSLDISILEARRMVPAYFESVDHYKVEDYRSLGDKVYDFNPLSLVVAYANKSGENEFLVADLAQGYRKDLKVMQGAMLSLAQKGLIGYNASSGLITVKPKAYHLYTSNFGKKDFDNIIFSSVIMNKPNASLNFRDGYMTVRGVETFRVSDSLNVIIEPDSSTITLLQDRGFRFDGKITAGNYEYYGRDFTFSYDSFLINLQEIDSVQFYVKDVNSRGGTGRKKINNSLVSDASGATQGVLYINRPNNKSGKVAYTEYPKFDSGSEAVVFFNNKDMLGGVYDKSINFVVPPFAVDSLSGDDPTSITFDGQFVSEIFPTFDAKLEVMPDYSMGFEYTTPTEGLNLYGSESRYYNDIKLDKNGLRGAGKISHLSMDIASKDFLFYPDSVVTQAETLVMNERRAGDFLYPDAHLENFDMKWVPEEDRMVVQTRETAFLFYDDFASFEGEATIRKDGVFGTGVVESRGSRFESEDISFANNTFASRHALFEMLSSNPEKPLLEGTDVKLDFNLNDSTATISPEVEGEAAIVFPYAQFNTSITEAKWDLEEQKIFMTKPEDVPIESSYFYTTREDLDSLAFNATSAEYDLKTNELKVMGIPYITVADARITPENGEVLILENSKIGRLTNTTIVLDTLNGYHTLTDGVIDVISRNEFSGYATYHFINSIGDSVPVRFDNFRLETMEFGSGRKAYTEQHSVADGNVREDQDAMVAPGMFYKGGMTLYAHKPTLELDGYIKLDMDEPGYDTWIKHSSSGDEEKVVLNFSDNVTEDGRPVVAGLHFSTFDGSLYRTFITPKLSPDDDDFYKAGGVLYYDEENNDFVIEDPKKASGESLAGRIFRYNKSTKNIRFEGPANFLPSYSDVSFKSSVIGTGNMEENTFAINAMLAVEFAAVPDQILEAMTLDIMDVITNFGAPEASGDPTTLLYKLADVAGERAAREYEKASMTEYISLGGFVNETTVSLMFSNVDFKWSDEYNGFYNVGKIGLSNIDKNDINAAMDGFMEIRRKEDGEPVFNVFLKVSAASWYFFSYEDNRLLMFSSNDVFNQLVSEKSNGAKAKIGELVFAPADRIETLAFINAFRSNYLGIDDEYFLDSAVETVVDENEDGFGGKDKDDGFEDEDDGF